MDSSKLCFAGLQQPPTNDPNLVSAVEKLLVEHLQPPVMMAPTQIRHFAVSFLSILVPVVEKSARNAAKEVLDLATKEIIADVLKSVSRNETLAPERQHLELKFIGKVRRTIYTGEDIKGEEGGENNSIQVALVDADGNIIKSGPEASSEVEILVIADDDDEDSHLKLMKRPPILSKKKLKLEDGIAILNKLKFRNKSEWTKGCRIKLLARITGNNTEGHPTVKDATSESFLLRDCRSLHNKKHDIPLLSSEVWRLHGIPKNGNLCKLLEKEKIKSVKDLRIFHNTEPQRLQQILGISDEKLMVILDHAKTCEIPNSLYAYYTTSSGGKNAVVFDEVGCMRGIINEDDRFVPAEILSDNVKDEANEMVISAFRNWKNVKPYDNEASTSVFPSQLPSDAYPSTSATAEISSVSYPEPYDQTIDGLDLAYYYSPPMDTYLLRSVSFNGWNPDPDFLAMMESNDFLIGIGGGIDDGFNGKDDHSSKKAKGRWKRVIMTLKFMSMRKRKIVAPGEHSRTQKKQKLG